MMVNIVNKLDNGVNVIGTTTTSYTLFASKKTKYRYKKLNFCRKHLS